MWGRQKKFYSNDQKKMGFMKSFIKKYLPESIKIIAGYQINKSVNPFNLRSSLLKPEDISDFFIWSPIFSSVEFIAENTNAIINGKEDHITHIFKFYSPNGDLLNDYKYTTKDYISRIKLDLNIYNKNYKYISFTHFTEPKIVFKVNLQKQGVGDKFKVNKQSRGYTIYYSDNSIIGSVVHGNFGGIAASDNKTAKQRVPFIYTPVYKFDKNSIYDLVINNPTEGNLNIRLYSLSDREIKKIEIPSMGTDYIELKDFSGGISFESKLPMCRPIIFKNPPPSKNNFDVFHG